MGLWIFFLMAISPIILCMLLWWRFDKSVIYKKTKSKTIKIISAIIFCLIPTYDIVLINIFGIYYHQKTFLNLSVNKPISVYFENNISPYTQKELRYYSRTYLFDDPGIDYAEIHKVALNGDDGKIYLYYFDTNSSEYKKISEKLIEYYALLENRKKAKAKFDLIASNRNNIGTKEYSEALDFLKKVADTTNNAKIELDKLKEKIILEKIITKSEIKNLDYTVKLKRTGINKIASMFVYINEIEVIDNNTAKLIGYNQHIFRRLYNIFPFGGGSHTEMYEKDKIRHRIFYITNLSDYDRK